MDERILRAQIRKILSEKNRSIIERHKKVSLASLLFEEQGAVEMAQEMGIKPITLVLLYGPPAAGKGAAEKAVPKFAGVESSGDEYSDFLKSTNDAFKQEEDAAMVGFTTKELPKSVFKSLFDRVEKGEKYEDIVKEYFHVNEKGKRFDLSRILTPNAFEKLRGMGRDKGAEEFLKFKNTEAYFTQARGFSNPSTGLPDLPGDASDKLGPNDGTPTIGARLAAAKKYLDDVKGELKSILGGKVQTSDSKFASIYLADQAGESTANIDRIKEVGKMKEEIPGLKIIGIYIHQPAARTEMSNLHRAATGGRRVAQSEVDRIYKSAPTIEDGKIVDNGPAIQAMLDSNFDQVHVYYPKEAFDPAKEKTSDGRPVKDAICEPFGDGTGALDIEGCEDEGSVTDVKSLQGLEQIALKKSGIEPDKGGGIPTDIDSDAKEKVVKALNDVGFKVDSSQLDKYLKTIEPPGIRGGGKFGKTPWSSVMFGGDDKALKAKRDPNEKITLKGESRVRRNTSSGDAIVVERWQKLAGIIKG